MSLASVAFFLSGPTATAGDAALEDAALVDALLTSDAVSCDDIGMAKERLMNVLTALKAEIRSQLKRGKQVQLDGFGTFYLERMEAPVQPGMKTKIPVREVVHFKAHNAVWTQGGQPNAAYVLTNR